MVSNNFEDSSEDDLIIHCNIVSALPVEYDCISEVSKAKDEIEIEEAVSQKHLYYYVMCYGVIKEQQTVFEKPKARMMNHHKPLFIRTKVDGFPVNKVFVDGGAALNLMPQSWYTIVK